MKKTLLTIACFLLFFSLAFSQTQSFKQNQASFSSAGWLTNDNFSRSNAFIENAGQLIEIEGAKNSGILFQLIDKSMQVSFTSRGLIYQTSKREKVSEREWERYAKKNHISEWENEEREIGPHKDKFIPKTSVIEMNWENANPNMEISAKDPTSNYFNYFNPTPEDKKKIIGNVKGFKKIVYKNVYPFIDVEYTIHPKEGIKYSYILHPGADPSMIKMRYTGADIKLDEDKNLQFITPTGNITDHAPLTYKGEFSAGKIIGSEFQLSEKNIIGFKLANGNAKISETTVIDPWQVGPSFPIAGYTPNDIAVDGAGNVVVYSYQPPPFLGVASERIDKYNSAGVLQWTFDLSANAGYTNAQGDVAADPAGNIYAGIGLGPNNNTAFYNTIKINSAGTALIWGNSSAGTGSNNMMETWTITFNCNFSQFYQSGGGRIIGGTTYFNISVEEPVNAATGTEGVLIQNDSLGDIYCTYYSPNSLVYHLTTDSNVTPDLAGGLVASTTGAHNNLICFNPGTGTRLFKVQTGYSFIDGDLKAPGSVGMNAMVSSCQYLYTMNGAKLDRWNPTTGAHFNQVIIPGGNSFAGGSVNSGILTDKCGNVYVGSNGNIYVYDPTLNLINTIGGLPGVVFDMAWTSSANTDIVVCGGTSNATTFLADVAVAACVLPNTVTVTPTQPTCAAPGSAIANATFCGAPYSYLWSDGQTTQTASNLGPGTYTVTVSSSVSCPYTYVETQTVTINNPTGSPTVTVNSPTICNGNSTTLTAGGATTYSWSPGTGLSSTSGTSVTANPTATTTYTVTGTTAGCTGTNTSVVTVNPTPTLTVNSPTICNGSSTTLTATGATTYSWSPGTGLSTTTGASVTANPTSTTTYTIIGTTATCTSSITSVVTVNPMPTVTVNNPTYCTGGSAVLTAGGATTYSWSPAAGLSATTGTSVTANPTSTTTYTVVGTSATCTASATSLVTVVTTPTVVVNSPVICNGSSTTLTAGGATTFSWSPGTGLSSTSGTSVTANPTATTIYTVTGTAGTCTGTATSTVTVNPLPTITVNSGTICIGQQTATLTAGGATTFTWSPATGLSSTNGASVTATPTTTTNYTVTGTDGNGCVNTHTTSVVVNPLPTITANNGFVCNGGSTTLNANGASTYTWSPATGLSSTNGASVTANPTSTTNYTITGTDVKGCINTDTTSVFVVTNPIINVASATICFGNSTTLTATGATTYTWSPATGLSSTTGSTVTANPTTTTVYTITGTVGTCTAVTTATVTVNPLPVIIIGSNSPICVNQTLNLTSSGGTSYSWNGPNAYTSTQQNPTVTGVTTNMSGIYTVTVTDANTCINTATVNVTVNPLPVVTVTGATVCIGATINITANGGTVYSWSGPNVYSSNQQNPNIPNATVNMSGNYVVTVTDANGCTNANIAQVSVNPSLLINATNNGPICQNATLNLFASSGVSWNWTGPGGYASFSQNPSIPNAQQTVSGTYTVVGTDANGCTGTDTTTVVVNQLPTITVTSGTICVTQQTATLTANGGVTYTWTPSVGLSSNTGSPVNANPFVTTSYVVTGTNVNGCKNTATSTVTVNQLPTVTASSGVICLGNSTVLTANGAQTYTWSPPTGLNSTIGSTVTASPGATTNYTVTGTDANGCFNTGVTFVTVNSLPVVSIGAGVICIGKSTTLNASGAITYNWSPPGGLSSTSGASVSANPNATTTYTVIGTDVNGCIDTSTVLVTVNPLPVLAVGPKTTSGCAPVCVNLNNTSSATGNCSWTFGDGTTSSLCTPPNHCFTGQGTFYAVLTLTDANGCTNTDTAKVIVYPIPIADFSSDPQPTTILDPLIFFHDQSSAANITQWHWAFGNPNHNISVIQNPSFTYAEPGSYPVQLIVTSDYGCVDSITKIIIINEDFMIYVPNAFTPNFDGTNDVFFAKGEGIKDFKLYVFDRWGNQVFYSEDITKGWDGRFQAKGTEIVQEDVYVWKIELKTFSGEPRQLKGTVSLLK